MVEEIVGGTVQWVCVHGHSLINQTQLISGNWVSSFYGYDGHGSVRFLTDSTGTITDSYTYDAFGSLIASTGSTPNNYLYAGEQFDPNLGFYYLWARYMNSSIGRFWTMDVLGGLQSDPLSLHKYLYCSADPVNRSDPNGYFGGLIEQSEVVRTIAQLAVDIAAELIPVATAVVETVSNVLETLFYIYQEGGLIVTLITATGVVLTITSSSDRLPEDGEFSTRLPRSDGRWLGEPGNSGWQSTIPEVNAVTGNQPIPFRNNFPDFSQWQRGTVQIAPMTGQNSQDFRRADEELARMSGWLNRRGEPDKTRAIAYRRENRLTWHHVEDGITMMLVPRDLNGRIPHLGGASISRGEP